MLCYGSYGVNVIEFVLGGGETSIKSLRTIASLMISLSNFWIVTLGAGGNDKLQEMMPLHVEDVPMQIEEEEHSKK